MSPNRFTVWPGQPSPLGATFDGYGVNFALFSAHAEKVELCIFDAAGRRELARIALPEYTDEVWHGYLPEVGPGLVYGYRVHGPWAPERGHRFNPNKLLLDPYAKEIRGSLRWSDALYAYRVGSGREDLSFDRRDSAPAMPKAVVIDPAFTWGSKRRPGTPFAETVIYEAHVKGMTRLHPEVPPPLRGTFAGLAHPAVIEHLLRLGITAIELMPVHFFVDDRFLVERGLVNYWGYNSLGYFAPEPRYLSPGAGISEFKTMVRRLHEAGIEVLLDVVYNHTAEGNHLGPTLCFRGIDNASYYRLMADNPRYYEDPTGCGNALDLSHPRVLQLVMDSLRYWVVEMHVDGFRFDLATTLGREGHGFDPGAAFFDAIRQDPVLSQVKLIAEPWDIGPEGYRLGGYGPGWAEWNDRFRDTVRAFWRGDAGVLPELGARLLASSDLFEHQGRRPWASVNFVTSHDGFTLHDLVSYNEKHNEANGENNRDGHDHNLSYNHGVEGPTDDPEIDAVRRRQMRNMLATVLFAQGTPMLLMGDEFARTQQGNNNAYCQDNEISWLDWSRAADWPELAAFVARAVALRQRHPVLRRTRFLHGLERSRDGIRDVTWIAPDGREMHAEAWRDPENRTLGLMLCGAAGEYRGPRGEPLVDGTLLLLMNAAPEPVTFQLPRFVPAGWLRLLDTAEPHLEPEGPPLEAGAAWTLAGRSLALFELVPLTGPVPGDVEFTFGPQSVAPGATRFRLYAPACDEVALLLGEDERLPMTRRRRGWFELLSDRAGPGTPYRFRLPGGQAVPDPASEAQQEDVHGPSLVVDHGRYVWQNAGWRGRPWHETVLYELHVGTFSPEGDFAGVCAKLDHLAELGVTAIELMPVADFAGARGWGYDGVLPYAPERTYGDPDALKALVDAAHARGLMVFLDVVYNHFGPEGNYLGLYAPDFFRHDVATPWGAAIDFTRREVRDFFVENALYWLELYRIDGLRLDAVHAIVDPSQRHILSEIAERVRSHFAGRRHVHLVLENEANSAGWLGRDGAGNPLFYDAQWNDDFHHAAHVLLTGERDAYYVDYADRPLDRLGRALAEGFVYQGERSRFRGGQRRGEPSAHLPPTAFVNFLQNHDQVGNRAFGERLATLADPRALGALHTILLLAPQIPLLFMGEEWGATTPFLFFCDFPEPLASAVREGRRREFARFPAFSDAEARARIPDPCDEATFFASRLDWSQAEAGPHRDVLERMRRLLRTRHERIVPLLAGARGGAGRYALVGERGLTVSWRLGDDTRLHLLACLGDGEQDGFTAPAGELLDASDPAAVEALASGRLPAWSAVWFLEPRP